MWSFIWWAPYGLYKSVMGSHVNANTTKKYAHERQGKQGNQNKCTHLNTEPKISIRFAVFFFSSIQFNCRYHSLEWNRLCAEKGPEIAHLSHKPILYVFSSFPSVNTRLMHARNSIIKTAPSEHITWYYGARGRERWSHRVEEITKRVRAQIENCIKIKTKAN